MIPNSRSLKVMREKKTNLIVVTLIVAAIALRFWLAANHFAHYDDLWGYYRALSIKSMPIEEFREKLPFGSLLLAQNNVVSSVLAQFLKHLVAVKEATYLTTLAPMHYFLSLLPVGFAESYKASLSEARLVSVIEYIVFFLLLVRYASDQAREERHCLTAFACLSLFGGLPLYYSVQGHNYMAGLLSYIVYISVLARYDKWVHVQIIARSLVYSACILTSYSFIIFLPSYYLAEYSIWRKRGHSLPGGRLLYRGFLYLVLLQPAILALGLKIGYIMRVKSGSLGVGWNKGVNNEYIVSYNGVIEFFSSLYVALKSTLTALFLTGPGNVVLGTALTIIIAVLFILGVAKLLRQHGVNTSVVFSLSTILTWFALYLVGASTIAPTRHSLIYFAPIAVVCSSGYPDLIAGGRLLKDKYLSRQTETKMGIFMNVRVGRLVKYVVLTIFLILSFGLLKDQISLRQDPVNDKLLSKISHSDVLVYDGYYNYSLAVAPELRNMVESNVELKGAEAIGIKKVKGEAKGSDMSLAYATNSYYVNSIDEVIEKLTASDICSSARYRESIINKKSDQVIDLPPSFLTGVGTNSLTVYLFDCRL